MPACNAEAFIGESIKSVLSQTFENWELIIIDDGSTDNTALIIQPFLNDQRVVYHYQPNAKQGVARNKGLALAKGELIAFLDSDDLWLPQKLEVTVSEFEKGFQDLLFTGAYIFENNNFDIHNIPPEQRKYSVEENEYCGDEGLATFLNYNRIPALTVLIKKQALINTGLFSDRGICEDYEMWLRMLLKGYKFRSITTPLAAYREHPAATTHNDRLAIDNCIDVIYSLKQQRNEQIGLFNRYLNIWYLRKLEKISNFNELKVFFEKIKLQKHWNYKLSMVYLFNFNTDFIYKLNKKITKYIIAQNISSAH